VVSAPDWKLSGLGSIPAPPHTTAGKSSMLENTALGRAAGRTPHWMLPQEEMWERNIVLCNVTLKKC